MQTQIKDSNGNLLWDPTNVDGSYTVKKAQSVSDIIKELLENLQIKAVIKIDEESLVNVYTKDEADARFVLLTSIDGLIDGKISNLIVSGEIIGKNEISSINSKLLSLYITCYGTNFDGDPVIANSYNQQIQNLNDQMSSQYTSLSRLIRDLYGENSDGSVNWNVKEYAVVSDTGKLENLSPSFIDENRSTLVAAINYTQSQVNTKDDIIGSGTLNTESKNLIGAVNELLSKQSETNTSISNLSNSIASLSSSIASMSNSLNDAVSRISSLESAVENLKIRVQNLENRL